MYISDVNRETQKELAKFCERNDLGFEIWERPDATDLATFFFHNDKRLSVLTQSNMITIYCFNEVNEEIKDDWIMIDTKDYYQVIW